MKKTETKKVLQLIAGSYPGFDVTAERITVWHGVFKTVEFQDVAAVLVDFLRSPSEFAPTPGQIFDMCPKEAANKEAFERLPLTETFDEIRITRKEKQEGKKLAQPVTRSYLALTRNAAWEYRKAQLSRGLGYVSKPHHRGHVTTYAALAMLVQIGFDSFNGETLPVHDFK